MTAREQARAGKRAWQQAILTDKSRRTVLERTAELIDERRDTISKANRQDMQRAEAEATATAVLDRLLLTDARIDGMIQGLHEVAAIPDPLDKTLDEWTLENGLRIRKVTVPLGLIGIIYEARPNVTIEAASLIFRAGNAVILRGGSAAADSNQALVACFQDALREHDLNPLLIQHLEDGSRASGLELMQAHDYVDVLVPRGSRSLIDQVIRDATVPVIQTGDGNCHLYVAASADPAMALELTINAKMQRCSVCNAVETLLVDTQIASRFLPLLAEALAGQCELRLDPTAREILGDDYPAATEEDWATEYNDTILAIRVVDGLEEALEHIRLYSTQHSEGIVTEDREEAERFLQLVDAAAVYHNASLRFTDGGVFGFGGELGISTQKLHARGPMGVEALVSYKYRVYGDGQIRSS